MLNCLIVRTTMNEREAAFSDTLSSKSSSEGEGAASVTEDPYCLPPDSDKAAADTTDQHLDSSAFLIGLPVAEEVAGCACAVVKSTLEYYDDEHVYANVQELKEESRRKENPPTPDVTEKPIRDLGNGWMEFLTETGRSYFFNRERGECSWKPPRFLKPISPLFLNGKDGCYDNPLIISHTVSGVPQEDGAPSYSSPESPVISAKPFSDTLESVDSGIDRTSLSVRSRMIDSRASAQALARELARRVEAFKSSEEIAAVEAAQFAASSSDQAESTSTDYVNISAHASSNMSQKSIKSGTLDKCKIADAGKPIKKREWTVCYVFLSSAHLIFYKDEKSAEKSGRHYEAPLGMCDLRGASVQWVEDKRRKHVLQLKLIDGTVYLFNTLNCQDINSWFHTMKRVIRKQPLPDSFPTPVLERSESGATVVRTSSFSQANIASPFGTSHIRRSSKKPKSASKDSVSSVAVEEKGSETTVEGLPSKATIMERLRRFFRSRPSIESLKDKGIYRTEPVFGNTLTAICQNEKSFVPKFILVVTEVIESKGLDTDGLYRVSGNLSAIQRIRCAVDQDKYLNLLNEDDVHVLTGALKLFFRELAEPIFPSGIAKEFISANRLPVGEAKTRAFNDLLRRLPLVHRETLKILFSHLLRVADRASKNRMEVHNLAIIFGPSLFSSGEGPVDPKKIAQGKKKVGDKKGKEKAQKSLTMQSNSHFVFNMIMQGQIVEYLLSEFRRFSAFQENPIEETSV